MPSCDYWEWRGRALQALSAKTTELRDVKDWIGKHRVYGHLPLLRRVLAVLHDLPRPIPTSVSGLLAEVEYAVDSASVGEL